MRWKQISLAAGCVLSMTHVAAAEVRNFVIKTDNGTSMCVLGLVFDQADSGRLTVSIADPAENLGAWSLTFARASDAAQLSTALIGGKSSATASVSLTEIQPGSKISLKGVVDGKEVSCTDDRPVQQGAALTDLDDEAEIWLASDAGKRERERLVRARPGVTDLLVHLPSGRAAANNRDSLREDELYQPAAIIDANEPSWVADVNVLACPERDLQRIYGNFDGFSLQTRARQFRILLAERPLRCGAGTMEYAMRITRRGAPGEAIRTPWTVRPVYRLAAAVGLGFDGGKTVSYSVVDKKVVETRETLGTTTKIGFIWYPGGIDFMDMRWHNYVSPFLLFDLDAPREAFALGAALSPTGGISLLIGGSFRKSAVAQGFTDGDPFEGDGAVPTVKQWNNDSVGWYLGVALDNKIYTALRGLMPKKKD